MKKIIFCCSLLSCVLLNQAQPPQNNEYFEPGKQWMDTDGVPIAAHGAGIMYHNGVYYWYGEARQSFHSFPGFPCYTSKDLLNWKNEGLVLKSEKLDQSHELHESNIIERPKVIYNAKTRKFVMWMHVENSKYNKANAGVAVSDSPLGPFVFLKSIRPNGHEARDMSLFQDEDGKAYLIFASEKNSTQHINLLTDDYLDVEGTYNRTWINQWREVPTIFKHRNKYYSITSLCTGFSPNAALWASADDIMGEWKIIDNPCVGIGKESSFRSQATFILPVAGKPDLFIYLADRWTPTQIGDSRYVWLPIDMKPNSEIAIHWYEKWNFTHRVPGVYTENPQGSPVLSRLLKENTLDIKRTPDVLIKRRIPEQDFSAMAWTGWKDEKFFISVLVYPESSSSLDGPETHSGEDLFDIWLDYFQVSVSENGAAWRVIPGGGGMGDYSGIALTKRFTHPAIKCKVTKHISHSFASLLQLPNTAKGNLYCVEVSQSMAEILDYKAGRNIAFALVLNNKDYTGRGYKNRGVSPAGFRWADTDSYHKLQLVLE